MLMFNENASMTNRLYIHQFFSLRSFFIFCSSYTLQCWIVGKPWLATASKLLKIEIELNKTYVFIISVLRDRAQKKIFFFFWNKWNFGHTHKLEDGQRGQQRLPSNSLLFTIFFFFHFFLKSNTPVVDEFKTIWIWLKQSEWILNI